MRRPFDPVLVTGSAGFVASHLIDAIRAAHPGRTIIGLDLRSSDGGLCDRYVRADIRRDDLVQLVGESRVRSIYHLAALCKEPGYPWREYFETNSFGTKRLVEAMSVWGTEELVFTSTMMVHAAGPWRRSETDFEDPDTAYGISKLQAEEALRSWAAGSPSRHLRIVRPGVVFGPGDVGNVVRLISALRRRRFVFIGRRDTVKGSIYVKDLANLLVRLEETTAPTGVFHAVFPEVVTISDFVDSICEAWEIRRSPPLVPYALALVLSAPFMLLDPFGRRFSVHPRRIQKLFQDTNLSAARLAEVPWAPRYTLVEAFRDWRHSLEKVPPAGG